MCFTHLIFDFSRIMSYDKCIFLFLRFLIEFIITMDAVEFL